MTWELEGSNEGTSETRGAGAWPYISQAMYVRPALSVCVNCQDDPGFRATDHTDTSHGQPARPLKTAASCTGPGRGLPRPESPSRETLKARY